MKLFWMLISLSFLLTLGACKGQSGKFDTPEATFETLQEAIRNKDMELYKQCWDPSRVEKEGSVSQLESKPELWAELQGIFKGPQKLSERREEENEGRSMVRFKVEAPEADQGGIGGITMVKMDKEWKMYTW